MGKLIAGFIMLILGASLIVVIADNGLNVTDKNSVAAEVHAITVAAGNVSETATYTVTNAPTGWKSTDCPITNFAIKNVSGLNPLTLTTDYTLTASTGVYQLKNTTATRAYLYGGSAPYNNTYASYTYCGDDYMNLGWGRTSINLVAGFFALALLGGALGLFYSIAKEEGMF